jgi:hypothetical protein
VPFNAKQSAAWADKEILKFPVGLHAIKSVVLDATDVASWPAPAAGVRFYVPAGTILELSATNVTQYIKYNGGSVNAIKGILARPIDMVANATSSDEPAPMFFHDCIFATNQIVDFTLYASALVNDLGNHNMFE